MTSEQLLVKLLNDLSQLSNYNELNDPAYDRLEFWLKTLVLAGTPQDFTLGDLEWVCESARRMGGTPTQEILDKIQALKESLK